MRGVILDAAENDLERIGDFIAQDNPARAFSYIRELRAACAGLGEAPMRYQIVERYRRFCIRQRPFGRYLIFYKVFTDRVEIQRILHGSRDIEIHLDI